MTSVSAGPWLSPAARRRLASSLAAALVLTLCWNSDGAAQPGSGSPGVSNAAARCANLQRKAIDAAAIGEPSRGAVVTAATYKMAAGDAPNAEGTAMVKATPDYCQVLIDILPIDPAAPVVKAEVNLPAAWNGKSVQNGGGGLNGRLVTGLEEGRSDGPETPLPLTQGYMTLGTDSGHEAMPGADAGVFALNDEAFTNYAYAAYKKTHDAGTQLSLLYYGRRPAKNYYVGGSEGGREGLIMAERYPSDFDGIVAVDPVIRLIGLWQYQLSSGAVQSTRGSWLGGKLQLIQDTVEAACDDLDGIKDHVVANTKACKPLAAAALAAKRCASGADEGAACFSDAQLATLRWTYDGVSFEVPLANGLTSYPGYLYGSEGVPGALGFWVIGGSPPTAQGGGGASYGIGTTLVRYFVTRDTNRDPLTFKAAPNAARLRQLSETLDMTNPDLGAFYAHGGKLILRENLSDKGNSPQTGIDYYNEVVARMGQSKVDTFFYGYGATGLPHTSAGLAAGTANAPAYGTAGHINLIAVLDGWVTKRIKPADRLVLTNRKALPPYDLVASRPMCRFDFYPRYIGRAPAGGNLESNYKCTSF